MIELHRLQKKTTTDPFHLLMMSHSCIAVLYLYMTTSSLSVNYIFRMFALLFHSFVVVERINVPM